MGPVTVTRFDDCAGFRWRVRWETGGDKNQFKIASINLTGKNVGARVMNVQDGGANFYPIMDDFVETTHSKPQIRVSINNILAKCESNCDFEWLESSTPNVNSIDKTNPSSIILTGTGFSTVPENNIVKIGETLCTVTSATETQLTCTPENGPVGVYTFSLNVLEKGIARINSADTYEFLLTGIDVSPSIGGTGGGLKVNITGSGFSNKTQVLVDGNSCNVLFSSYNLIICEIPSNVSFI